MKNKKLILFVTGLLVLVFIFQLSFTYFANRTESRAKKVNTVNGVLNKESYMKYMDSIADRDVYNLGLVKFSYNECKEKELGLGLDLRGGMNVILEVSKPNVIKNIAGSYNVKQPSFMAAIAEADKLSKTEATDYVDLFVRAYKKLEPNKALSGLFSNIENKDIINNNTSDADVIDYLKTEIKEGIDRAYQVLETRLNQSSIAQTTLQKLDGGRISAELPGAENPERVRRLLQRSAALEFWEMYENNQANQYQAYQMLVMLDSMLSMTEAYGKKQSSTDTGKTDNDAVTGSESKGLGDFAVDVNADAAKDSAAQLAAEIDSAADALSSNKRNYPLFERMSLNLIQNNAVAPGPMLGYVPKYLLPEFKSMINSEAARKALPSDWVFAFSPKAENGFYRVYALKADRSGKPSMSGDMIKNAQADNDPQSGVVVSMTMKPDAAKDWATLTRNNASKEENKQYIAVVLDSAVYSAPGVSEEISGGNTQISGGFDLKEAQDLANVLKAGKLPVPVQIIAEDVVGPSLGAESINNGFRALLLGFLAVLLFMIAYYSTGGFIANLAVLLNVFFILGTLGSMGVSLTLPGIAGILLTIGMAVDANVLIYERIKEELATGKTLKTSVQLGYKAAFSAIIDSNITTLISGVILTFSGTGPVYGFAVILIIGIFSSLFTALLISRLIVEGRVDKGKEIKFSTALSAKILNTGHYNFIAKRKRFYIISGIVVLISIGALVTRGIPLGLDFKGGYSYFIQFEKGQKVSVNDIQSRINKSLPNSGSEIKTIGTDNMYRVTTTYKIDNNDNETPSIVQAEVIKSLADIGVTEQSIQASTKVGPTMASSTRNKSFIVTLAAIFAMFGYIVFRFRNIGFGLGATIALMHDVLIVFGVYALFNGILPFSLELDQTFVAALLTLIGYSVNDTVVVFDRIRESMADAKGTKASLEETINGAINQTLSRTLVTSGTTLLAVFVLFLFGGVALKGFSFSLLIGILVGTYSSIFIATPIVVDFIKKNRK